MTSELETESRKPTHRQLCELGARFIFHEFYRLGAPLVGGFDWNILIEPGWRKELPDVFAFSKNRSVLIECKASRADFLKDKRKPFRINPELGVGAMRFYLVNEGVARPEEMPDQWQLMEALDKDTVRISRLFIAHSDALSFHVRNATAEIELMYSWLYRKQHNFLPDLDWNPVNIEWR